MMDSSSKDHLSPAEENQRRYELAMRSAHLAVWEYDPVNRRLFISLKENSSFLRQRYGFFQDHTIENVPRALLDRAVGEEDRHKILGLFEEIHAGQEYVTADIWFHRAADNKPTCDRVSYYVLRDAAGHPLRAYGVSIDVTKEKQELLNFHHGLQSILTANPDALCVFQLNLTTNRCYEGHGASPFILDALQSDTVDGLFVHAHHLIPDEAELANFLVVFNRQQLLAAYQRGKRNLHLDYRRQDEKGGRFWVRTFISMLGNPENGHIEGVLYSLDITREMQRSEIFQLITNREYYLVALLHPDTQQVEMIQSSRAMPPEYLRIFPSQRARCSLTDLRTNGARTWVAEEDRQKYLEGTTLEKICAELDQHSCYEITVHGYDKDGRSVYRKLQHYYLDEYKDSILIINSDVTAIYARQQKKMVTTIGNLPSNSALFRILDEHMIIPESYSDEFCRMGGYTQQDDLFRDNAYGGIHPEDTATVKQTVLAHLNDDQPFHLVYRIITKAKTYLWVSVNFNTFSLDGTRYLYGVYTDISDLKQQEQLLTEQYNTAQQLLDAFSEKYLLSARVDLTANSVERSKGVQSAIVPAPPWLLGKISYDDILQQFLQQLPDDREREEFSRIGSRAALLQAYARGTRDMSQECRYLTADGEILWIRCYITLSRRPDSENIILFFALRDINEEKLIKATMDKVITQQYDYLSCISVKTHRILLFYSNIPTLSNDVVRQREDYDRIMRRYNRQYVLPNDLEACNGFMDLDNVCQQLRQKNRCLHVCTVDEGQGPRTKQVEFFYLDSRQELLALARTDITEIQKEQKDQELRLRQALESAQKANNAKSDFLSRMSHDMRTPLNGIIGMTYLAQEADNPPRTRNCLENIDTASKFLLGLINDILDMTKAESDETELHPEPYSPSEFNGYLDAVIRPLCQEKDQSFSFSTNMPAGYMLLLDKLRFNQIVFNLLSNAVKYTHRGGTITYASHISPPDEQNLASWEITIQDNGIGMSADFQKILFEPFTRELRQETDCTQGTGLGLPIVKRLVALMGGSISVASQLGRGTAFTIRLNVQCIPAQPAILPANAAPSTAANLQALTGKHVLLCEDHPLNQEIARTLLEEKNMAVTIAADGAQGVEAFDRSLPGFFDLILMDIRMPVMNGYEATRRIRALPRPEARTIPIIAMTADAFADDIQKCRAAGMNRHIPKPINPQALFAALSETIASRQ